MKDYYYLLGIDRRATEEEIKKAYRKLSLKLHPDHNDNDDGFFQQRFLALQEAYQTLSDNDRRLLYNMELDIYNALQRNQKNSPKSTLVDDSLMKQQLQELQEQNEQLQKRQQQLLLREQALQEQEIKLRNEQIALRNQQEQFLRLQNEYLQQQKPAPTSTHQPTAPAPETTPEASEPVAMPAPNLHKKSYFFKIFWFLLATSALIALPLWFNSESAQYLDSNVNKAELTELTIKKTLTNYYKTLQQESPQKAAQRFFADSTFVLSSQPNDTTSDRKPISYYLSHIPCRWEIDWSSLAITPQAYQSYSVSYRLLLYPKDQLVIAKPLYSYQAKATISNDFKISQLVEVME
ncbi:MAG: J domain-containing protein [Chitinophagales bacterium]|nr:J domain-containing protein [Chitinophagales bacterium]